METSPIVALNNPREPENNSPSALGATAAAISGPYVSLPDQAKTGAGPGGCATFNPKLTEKLVTLQKRNLKTKCDAMRKILNDKMNRLESIAENDLDNDDIELLSVVLDEEDKTKEWVDSVVDNWTVVGKKKKKQNTTDSVPSYAHKATRDFHPKSTHFTKNLSLPPQIRSRRVR